MVRHTVGPCTAQAGSTSQKGKRNSFQGQEFSKTQTGVQKSLRKNPRPSSIRFSNRSPIESQTQRHQSSLEKESHSTFKRQGLENPLCLENEITAMVRTEEPLQIGSSSIPTPTSDNSYRRVSEWMGGLLRTSDVSGLLVTRHETLPHQCSRSHGSVLDPEEALSSEVDPYQSSVRQHSRSTLHQQRRIQVAQPESDPGHYLRLGSRKELVPVSNPPSGSPECDSGLTIQDETTGIRMVSGHNFIPVDTQAGSGPSGRSIRNSDESQTSLLFDTKHGPSGLCHRRINPGLEPLEEDLPISTSESSNESIAQTTLLPGDSGLSSTSLAKEQLVSSPPRAETPTLPDSIPQTNPSNSNTDCVRFLKDSQNPNFVDFMKFAAHKDANIDPENVLFIEADKRDSTIRQYDSAVKKLAGFLKNSDHHTRMTPNLAISFFRFLFDKGLAASTITTIKSALKKIFLVGFNINLADSYFSSIPKACARLRPLDRPQKVSWSLNNVLKLASDTDNESCSYITLLRKTLFLSAMASGARISELAALSRNPENIDFLPTGEVLLTPDRAFLAKNEDPQNRWSPWKIISLPQDPSLCPVTTLRTFLARSATRSSGPLFIREQGGTMTIQGIRQQILYFIKHANPESFPHAHDIRSIATSINYFQNMDFDDLKKYTGWKSPMVFKRHYLKNLQALKYPTVAAGSLISPINL
ncbi:uncharacterized protein [Palaemon carinicauda]|uniref:uncharacterized protein n=1 Tax=Palaemon carinicauda TaxID=392227 RepID=UPI0035B688D0